MKRIPLLLVLLLAAGCAVRLGGPQPEEYRTLALEVPAGTPASEVAARIRAADARVVIMAAAQDSAWFAEVAALSGLTLSGPGAAGPSSFAFFAGEAVGDTTLALPVEGGGRLLMHDALYQVDRGRFLDLMAIRLEEPATVLAGMRALMGYVATDVGHDAALVLAVHSPTAAVGDSVALLIGTAFADVFECMTPEAREAARQAAPAMRLFYGPGARMDCRDARVLEGAGAPLSARLVVER
jgi:hypothetical protein